MADIYRYGSMRIKYDSNNMTHIKVYLCNFITFNQCVSFISCTCVGHQIRNYTCKVGSFNLDQHLNKTYFKENLRIVSEDVHQACLEKLHEDFSNCRI